ncbi:ComEC/Rec2 family competence protein [Solicola sp. PLA-1-18]|uniref:ComEC/Rec2 family competence protein n=1 Tax=Solicola sp. PLA-1-18 TaxID=3380532 RepID=UPI003B81AF6D
MSAAVRPAPPPVRRVVRPDHRMVVPAVACWMAALTVVSLPPRTSVASAVVLVLLATRLVSRGHRVAAMAVVVGAGVLLVGAARVATIGAGPVVDAAEQRAVATVRLQVTSDPRDVRSPHGELVVLEASVRRIATRGSVVDVRAPVVVWADEHWRGLEVGAQVDARVRVGPSDDSAASADLDATGRPTPVADPAWWWDGAQHLRDGVTASVQGRGADVSGLVPALVHGDDSGLPDDLADDFRTSGLTHLLAVSGTNLTLVVGFLLVVARWCRLPPRLQVMVGLLGTVGFVLLARPEPSVVRAAAMGLVALAGLGSGGRRRGMRALAWAVVLLLLVDPWLARTAGFVLSVSATAGILVLAPPWRDALSRWMPRFAAEALAVPMAAQLACTPVVAAVSGQVSVVAVAANLLAAPAVGPATVLGLLGGLVDLVSSPAGRLVGLLTSLPAGWICQVGRRCAALPGASVESGDGAAVLVALTLGCVLVAVCARPLLRRRWLVVLLVGAVTVVLLRPVSVGWPPDGWVMVACDVGQGDATVLDAGGGTAVVVDAGPEPRDVDRCLDRLGVEQVAAVLLTHGHADHVDGLDGVARGRPVGVVGVGPSGGPALPGVPSRRVADGSRGAVGDVSWEVLGPSSTTPVSAAGEGGAANDASLVLLVRVRGVRILLTGDIEPAAQATLLREHPASAFRADVLKVPHHGSSRQDRRFFEATGARLATVSAGEDNTYGHPAPKTLRLLHRLGMTDLRTDLHGDVAVVLDDGEVRGVVG